MLCMVRDLRSVIASMERVYRQNRHRPIGPDNPAELQNMTVGERAKHWLGTHPVGLALRRIADCYQRGIADEIHFIRYEDLCSAPDATMQGVYDYIEEASFKHDFQNLKKEVYEDCSHYGPYGNHTVRQKLEPADPLAWQEYLPDSVGAMIAEECSWFYNTFYNLNP
jgi:sulfotransferase